MSTATTTTIITTATSGSRLGHSGSLRIRVERRGGRSLLVEASGHVPYAARAVPAPAGWARAVLVQTIAGPLGDDRTAIEVDVGAGAALELGTNAATVALPASTPANYAARFRLAPGARLLFRPEPLVLAAGCDLISAVELDLAAGAVALVRELVMCGRHGEPPGRYRATLRCILAGRPLLHDGIEIDGKGLASASAAVLAGARGYGSLALLGHPGSPSHEPAGLALAGPGRVLRALAPDAQTLRDRIAAAERAWVEALTEPGPRHAQL